MSLVGQRHLGATVTILGAALIVTMLGRPAFAQTFSSGSTGADGPFIRSCAPTPCTVSVGLPPSGVFNFTTVTIPVGVTVTFVRDETNTPATILASGNVSIAGAIDVSGGRGRDGIANATSVAPTAGPGGPGGFDGGNGSIGINAVGGSQGGGGLGPGGGLSIASCGGSFATQGGCGGPTYGTASLLPLVGGSGGAGGGVGFGSTAPGGGGGGGALLIASTGTLTVSGTIVARGGAGGNSSLGTPGGGGGSGGAIRLIATTVTGSGRIDVSAGGGGTGIVAGQGGGLGRIRVESFVNTAAFTFAGGVSPSLAAPGPVMFGGNVPTLTIISIAGMAVPAAPTGAYATPDVTLPGGTTSPVTIGLAATNISPGSTVTVSVVGRSGGESSTTTALTGTLGASTASASVAIRTVETSVVIATTSFTLTAAQGAPFYADGGEVDRVTVTAGVGTSSRVTYLTTSGREVFPRAADRAPR
jgi:hypothetical protein